MTRILVIGAGSIGTRHATNLLAAGAEVDITDDLAPERAAAVAGAKPVPFDSSAVAGYDGVVVASPTALHHEHAVLAVEQGRPVLIEKPIALTVDRTEPLLAANDLVMVGYNLRLHEPLERLMELVHAGAVGNVVAARLWFGQWLPEWRPGVDYRSTYSAQAALGGGILLDAIHELDLLLWLAGDDDFSVHGAVVDRVGPLEIDVEDTVRAVLRHHDGWPAEIALDYLSRRYRRGVEVIGETATARFDWATGALDVEDANRVDRTTFDVPVARSYEREAQRFLDRVTSGASVPVDARTGTASLRLAERIRAATA